ncbi:MAG: cobalt-precorrin-5B (C(1))-methyltransferase [Proteobacteria bacterium]|nr:cobalt-precorrin-5B (C(1))-methyltransferase [Pseudomonadota bacterium]
MTARKPQGTLRRGWTTGACATAAAKAAYAALLTGDFPDPVTITLPKGETPTFPLLHKSIDGVAATASIIKDAGDDPDVTHGAEIRVTIRPNAAGSGVTFHAGDGVGMVTLAGLPLGVGEPAINPAPRKMIAETLAALAHDHGVDADLAVTISIPGGEVLAQRTSNGRLGIIGGLSVLGTTGIVIPYSCASWIHSIQRGVDVARAAGLPHIAAATGRTSEAAAQAHIGLPDVAMIDMGDFAGGLLKYLRRRPVERLTIAGGFAKLVKLAQGNMDLHSDRSSVDFDKLAELLADCGADQSSVAAARQANTALGILQTAGPQANALAARVAALARAAALATLAGGTVVDVLVVDRQGEIIGHAGA